MKRQSPAIPPNATSSIPSSNITGGVTDTTNNAPPADLKIILLGDSAVGKSKLIERFLLDDYLPHQLSTYALTLYRYSSPHPFTPTTSPKLNIEFWDTAGQERFHSMHPSYYYGAHACILCFDVTRKITYKNLDTWYEELVAHRGHHLPVIMVGNKVDLEPTRAKKSYGFIERRRQERIEKGVRNCLGNANGKLEDGGDDADMPVYFVSASDGSNVVALFKEAIKRGLKFKERVVNQGAGNLSEANFVDEVMEFIREEEKRPDGLFSNSSNNNISTSNGDVDFDS